jgi:hypothetical protein
MWVMPVSAQVYCSCVIGAHYDLRVPYTTQFPSPWSRIFCLWHEMQPGPWVVMHGSAFPYTSPTNPPWKTDDVWIVNDFCFIHVHSGNNHPHTSPYLVCSKFLTVALTQEKVNCWKFNFLPVINEVELLKV